MFYRSLFVLLAIVLSVLLRYTDSNYPLGIFKLFSHIITRQPLSGVDPISATKRLVGQFCGSSPMYQSSHNRNLSGAFALLIYFVRVRVLFELLLYGLVYICVCTLSNQTRSFILIVHPICVLLCSRI